MSDTDDNACYNVLFTELFVCAMLFGVSLLGNCVQFIRHEIYVREEHEREKASRGDAQKRNRRDAFALDANGGEDPEKVSPLVISTVCAHYTATLGTNFDTTGSIEVHE